MESTVWGPPTWMFLHTMSFAYPNNPTVQQKRDYAYFLHFFARVLPCRVCREHCIEMLDATVHDSRHFRDRDAFSRYVYELHKAVNVRLGKTSPPYGIVARQYERVRVDSGEPTMHATVNIATGTARSDTIKFPR